MLHRSSFVHALREQLPDIEPWLEGYRDGLTFEMMRFRQFTEDAIARNDSDRIRRCFRIADQALTEGNGELRNSLAVTFLEHLDLNASQAAAARKLMSIALQAEYDRVNDAIQGSQRPLSSGRDSKT